VIDLYGVTNAWTVKKFESLPFISIQSIRTSQFQSDPLIARIVLDIDRSVSFYADQINGDIVVKIPAAPEETDFAEWQAQTAAPVTQVARQVAPPRPVRIEDSPKQTSGGVKIESYPKRKEVGYTTSGVRDPFMPLVGSVSGQFTMELPALENMTLVGILENVDGNRALLEDSEGNGYILMPNDKVKNGYLVTVTDTRAIFQITEYGWTRTVDLELSIPELR